MFDWFFHLLRLKSPREMRELDKAFHHDMRQAELRLARAAAETLTGERRERTLALVEEAERREAVK